MHGKKPRGSESGQLVVLTSHIQLLQGFRGFLNLREKVVFLTCVRMSSLSHNALGVGIPLQVKFLQDMHVRGFIYFMFI